MRVTTYEEVSATVGRTWARTLLAVLVVLSLGSVGGSVAGAGSASPPSTPVVLAPSASHWAAAPTAGPPLRQYLNRPNNFTPVAMLVNGDVVGVKDSMTDGRLEPVAVEALNAQGAAEWTYSVPYPNALSLPFVNGQQVDFVVEELTPQGATPSTATGTAPFLVSLSSAGSVVSQVPLASATTGGDVIAAIYPTTGGYVLGLARSPKEKLGTPCTMEAVTGAGKVAWQSGTLPTCGFSAEVDGLIVLAGLNKPGGSTGTVAAYSPSTGTMAWSRTFANYEPNMLDAVGTTLIISGSAPFGGNASTTAFDVTSGRTLWTLPYKWYGAPANLTAFADYMGKTIQIRSVATGSVLQTLTFAVDPTPIAMSGQYILLSLGPREAEVVGMGTSTYRRTYAIPNANEGGTTFNAAGAAFTLMGDGSLWNWSALASTSAPTPATASLAGASPSTSGWLDAPAGTAPTPGSLKAPNWSLLVSKYGANLDTSGRFEWVAPPVLLSSGDQVGLVTQNDVMGSPIPNVAVVSFSRNGRPAWSYAIPNPHVATAPVWTGTAIAFTVDLPASGAGGTAANATAQSTAPATQTLVVLSPDGVQEGAYPLGKDIPAGTTISAFEATPAGLLLALQRGTQPSATIQLLGLSVGGSTLWESSPMPGEFPSGGLAVLGKVVVVETETSSSDGGSQHATLRALSASTGKMVWVSVEKLYQRWTLEAAVGSTTIWSGFSQSGKPGWVALAAETGKQMWATSAPDAVNEDAWGPSQWVQCNGSADVCTLYSTATGAVDGKVQLPALPRPTYVTVVAMSSHYLVLGALKQLPPSHYYTLVVGINGSHYEKSYDGTLWQPLEYALPNGAWTVNMDESPGHIASLNWGAKGSKS